MVRPGQSLHGPIGRKNVRMIAQSKIRASVQIARARSKSDIRMFRHLWKTLILRGVPVFCIWDMSPSWDGFIVVCR